jgi:hypothetical protein
MLLLLWQLWVGTLLCPPLTERLGTPPRGVRPDPSGCYDLTGTTSLGNLFYEQPMLADLSDWDVTGITRFNSMFTGSLMADLAADGRQLAEACAIHASWTAQNAAWDPVVAGLLPSLTHCTSPPPVPLLCDVEQHVSTPGILQFDGNGCADTSQVQSLRGLFKDSSTLGTQPVDVDLSSSQNSYDLFANTTNFNGPVRLFGTTELTYVGSLFENSKSFNQPFDAHFPSMGQLYAMLRNAQALDSPVRVSTSSPLTSLNRVYDTSRTTAPL